MTILDVLGMLASVVALIICALLVFGGDDNATR